MKDVDIDTSVTTLEYEPKNFKLRLRAPDGSTLVEVTTVATEDIGVSLPNVVGRYRLVGPDTAVNLITDHLNNTTTNLHTEYTDTLRVLRHMRSMYTPEKLLNIEIADDTTFDAGYRRCIDDVVSLINSNPKITGKGFKVV